MKGFDWVMFQAVINEMLGFWFWIILLLAVIGLGGFLFFWIKDKGLNSRRLVTSELIGLLLGGPLALIIMAQVSSSGFTDAVVPIDWLLVGLTYGIGVVATTLLLYVLWRVIAGSPHQQRDPSLEYA